MRSSLLAPPTALVIALALSACGGAGDSPEGAGTEPFRPAGTTTNGETTPPQASDDAKKAEQRVPGSNPERLEENAQRAGRQATRRAKSVAQLRENAMAELRSLAKRQSRGGKARKLSRSELRAARVSAVEQLVSAMLSTQGFSKAKLGVSADATRVSISLEPKQACTARSGDERAMRAQTKKGAPFVRRVSVTVEGSGLSLSSYLRKRCGGGLPDEGLGGSQGGSGDSGGSKGSTGKVAFAKDGRGVEDTPEFEIHAETWTIEFINYGSIFQIYLYKDGRLQQNVVNQQIRGAGKKTIRGAGTYKLRIAGSAEWSVKVRDGG